MAWRRGGPHRGRGNNRGRNRAGRGTGGGGFPGQTRGNSTDHDRFPAPEQYLDLKRLLRRDMEVADAYAIDQSFRVWTAALAVLDGDSRDFHQCVARDLTSDELQGHEIIVRTAGICTRYSDDDTVLRTIEPLLRVLTHPALLDSISVDSFLGVIYRSFGGTNGDRGLALFSSLCRRLTTRATRSLDTSIPVVAADTVKLMLTALHQLVARKHRARFNDDLAPLFEAIDGLVNIVAASDPTAELQVWKRQLDVTRRIVDIATGRLVSDTHIEDIIDNPNRTMSSFPLTIAVPGGRHDNDHADIRHIQVLPTLEEISCSQAECLPSTNLLQPHHLQDPAHRHIDSLFRLLRHDIFGAVNDVLGELLAQDSQNPPTIANSDTRAHTYTQASIRHVFIHERRGLQAILSFAAPVQVRRKTKAEQRRWWQETSRLEEGSLVCLLAATGTQKLLLFLEVVTKRAEAVRDQRDQRHQQQQHNNTSCLISDTGLPSITVKLATRLQGHLKLLIQMYGQSAKIRGTLVEFHGLLPATFNPVLQNLQLMMGEGQMAFQQWLLPDGHGTDADAARIPPPAYARKPGFTFRLDSIA
ncbi:hypothetical protein BJ170DRAFT_162088 [Xylariales sp. AK1849]|nr:hypothetical protein BJ170DRAFT_162088 [Xylariales sp. AK1849]